MRTPLARSAAEGFGPRTATAILDRSSVNLVVAPRESVAANSARVPTPVWKMASFAGRSSSERTSAAMASGSRSGSSASAGARPDAGGKDAALPRPLLEGAHERGDGVRIGVGQLGERRRVERAPAAPFD